MVLPSSAFEIISRSVSGVPRRLDWGDHISCFTDTLKLVMFFEISHQGVTAVFACIPS